MKFTGERMIPEHNSESKIYFEHVNRYYFAKQFVQNKDVLDIACGSGYGTKILSDSGTLSILGVDISSKTISYCQKKYPDENFIEGSIESIPVSDNSMDVVVSFETVEHVDEKKQEKFMEEVDRVLRDDGIFILSTPNSLVCRETKNEFHEKELNPDELDALLKKFNFDYEIFFQDSIDSNYILSSKEIEGGKFNEKNAILFHNEEKRKPWDSRFLIVVCTKKGVTPSDFLGSVYVSNMRSIRHTSENDSLKKLFLLKLKKICKKCKKNIFTK